MADNKETILWDSKANTSWTILALTVYNGKNYLQLRVMWRKNDEIDDNDAWKFSKKVISFNFETFQGIYEIIKVDPERFVDKINTHLES